MFDMTAGWIEQYVSALVLLNVLLGHPTATVQLAKPTAETIVRTLNEIARGLYRPSRHFSEGAARTSFALKPVDLVLTAHYTVIVLNASTKDTDFASVKTGGIIFEDPAWAVFAAEGLAQERMLALPVAANDADLLKRLSLMETSVKEAKYKAGEFFAPVTGFVDPPVASFSLLQVTGAQLRALRTEGLATFGSPSSKIYEFFVPATVHP